VIWIFRNNYAEKFFNLTFDYIYIYIFINNMLTNVILCYCYYIFVISICYNVILLAIFFSLRLLFFISPFYYSFTRFQSNQIQSVECASQNQIYMRFNKASNFLLTAPDLTSSMVSRFPFFNDHYQISKLIPDNYTATCFLMFLFTRFLKQVLDACVYDSRNSTLL
jgi:hypothetical protein